MRRPADGPAHRPAPGTSVLASEESVWRSLARLAVDLTAVTRLEDLQAAVDARAREVLGAVGAAVVVPAEDGGWRLLLPAPAETRFGGRFEHEPHDSPLPACRAAREGTTFLVPDRPHALAVHPRMAEVVDLTGRPRWALLPLRTTDDVVGSLAVSWERAGPFDEATRALLDTFAAQCAPTLARLLSSARRDVVTADVGRMASHLQRSSLAELPARDGLSLAVGYEPVGSSVDIGGDWYDAFENRAGDLVLVLGDVSGHDDRAAASMSQVRALLRGVVWGGDDTPAHLLQRLDAVMTALEPGVLASAVLAVLHDEGASGTTVDWASAGHPSPLVRRPGRAVELLRDGRAGSTSVAGHERSDFNGADEGGADDRDPILGVAPSVRRHDHHARLAVGSALLLYSDGMVEARGEEFERGLDRLARRFAAAGLDDPTSAADRLMHTTRPQAGDPEDDRTVLLAVVRQAPGQDPRTREVPAVADPTVTSRALHLPAEAQTTARARQVVERACRDAGWPEDATSTAVLLTSELVTNALVHGRSDPLLTVRASAEELRVQVWDDNPRAPELLAEDDLALSGRGLQLVAGCAQAWGVEWPSDPHVVGKGVWFTLLAR